MCCPIFTVGLSAPSILPSGAEPPSLRAWLSIASSPTDAPFQATALSRRRPAIFYRCRLRLRGLPGAPETVRAAARRPSAFGQTRTRFARGTERLLAHLRLRVRSALRFALEIAPCRQPLARTSLRNGRSRLLVLWSNPSRPCFGHHAGLGCASALSLRATAKPRSVASCPPNSQRHRDACARRLLFAAAAVALRSTLPPLAGFPAALGSPWAGRAAVTPVACGLVSCWLLAQLAERTLRPLRPAEGGAANCFARTPLPSPPLAPLPPLSFLRRVQAAQRAWRANRAHVQLSAAH